MNPFIATHGCKTCVRMRTTMRSIRSRHRRGSEIIEAALVLPVLVLLEFGTIEFGYWFYVEHNLQGAAREGVRAAIPPGANNADVTTAVNNMMSASGFNPSDYTVTTLPTAITDADPGDSVTVTVEATWATVGVRPLSLISAEHVRGVAVMRKEGT